MLLAVLMVVSFATFGSVSPPSPQVFGDVGWQRLWVGNSSAAFTEFKRALEADPAFPYRWSDLGGELADEGKTQQAAVCFRRAVELAPDSPQIAIRAANFWFRTGATGEALLLESKIFAEVPDFDQMIFRSWTRMVGNTRTMLETGIGTNGRAARAFFDFLIANGYRDSLGATWAWMESHGFVSPQQGREWADYLLRANNPAEAAGIWAAHVAIDEREYGKSNWVDNGGFEKAWSDGAFDWNSVACPGVTVSLDNSGAHGGERSLRLEFNSDENLSFHHFFQRTWMRPGEYRLEGWIRTSGFTTDQGLGLRVLDPAQEQELNAMTPGVTGTTPWTRVSKDFVVAGHPRLVEIQVIRQPSWSLDNHPHGTAWVDDVRVQVVRRIQSPNLTATTEP